jgi:DNA-binding LacI/PurR family transcriptional regulator
MARAMHERPPARPGQSRYREIAADLRSRIAKQHRPGDMLASERDLAARYAVNQRTVRQALDVLTQGGLVARHHGRGTVVVDRHATGEFAVVIWPHFLRADASPYFGLACTAITDALQAHNPHWAVKLHMGQAPAVGVAQPSTLDLLEPDVLKRLRGVFSFHRLDGMETGLEAAQVPMVFLCESDRYCSAQFDYRSFYKLALAHLREAGCRRVGALHLGNSPQFEPAFAAGLRANRLKTRTGWNVSFDEKRAVSDPEQDGYESFMRLWDQPERPDGLLVTDDIFCRGVLRAILHLGIELPDTLRLVSYANRGAALPYHQPVTRVEFDAGEQARVAVEMMMAVMSGRRPPSRGVYLPGKLVKGATT